MSSPQHAFPDQPAWQRQVRKRLAVSTCIAFLLLAAVILLVKFSPLPVLHNTKIELRLVAEIEPPITEPAVPEQLMEPKAVVAPAELADVLALAEPPVTDWYADAESAVQETVATANHVDSMHSAFDEKRRRAAINFPASRAPVKKPIWENVETDQIGRKILVSGNCYRVLEDPRATYYEIQRAFGQYITFCNGNTEKPMDVAWIEDIRQNYAYLVYPDGEIPQDVISQLSRQYQLYSQE